MSTSMRRPAGFALCGWLASATAAAAHPGHGDPRWAGTILHYWLEPEHALPAAIAVLGAALSAWGLARVLRVRPRSRDRDG